MTLETFFEKFNQFADAPDAVAKMRELILESAIRGMLVPHNASDEPASELLKRIARLQDGQARKQAALPSVGDDAYLEIPPGWEWTRLGNTGRIFNGDSVSESGKAELAKVEDGLPFIATKDVGYGRAALVYVNGLKVPLRDPRFKVARANAVLICAEGGSAGRKIGVTDRDICFGNKLFANEVWEGIHHRYVFYVYQAPTFFKEFAARMTGIIGGIARSEFLSLPFPLPPLAEQKRIVAKVDELMALCDRLEAQQQERETRHAALARASLARFADAPTPANLPFLFHPSYAIPPADLRKSILTLAVQGKLIPNDPDGKPVGMKLSGGLHGGSSLAPNWRAGLLGDAFNFEYGDNLPGPKRSQSGEYPVYGSNGIVGTHNTYLTKEPAIIVGRKGSAGALNIADGPSWTTDVAYFVRPPRDIDLRFTYYLFSTLRLDDLGKGIKPGLSRKDAYALSIALPPLAEQRRIVAKVEQLMALVDELETQLAASRATAANLLSAFVAELTGSPHNGKLSFPSASTTGSRGRPRKA